MTPATSRPPRHPASRPAGRLRRTARRLGAAAAVVGALVPMLAAPGAQGQSQDPAWAELTRADPAHGRRLIAEHQCSQCHARRVGGDGSAIYRPDGRISRPAALLAMVEMCNTELNLQLFPDDVAAIAAALNQAHYRFTPPPRP